ncbi:hypothetical protein ACIP6I_28385 [Streptomyces anulatus]
MSESLSSTVVPGGTVGGCSVAVQGTEQNDSTVLAASTNVQTSTLSPSPRECRLPERMSVQRCRREGVGGGCSGQGGSGDRDGYRAAARSPNLRPRSLAGWA